MSLIGQPTLDMRIRIDGVDLPAPDVSALGIFRYQEIATVPLAPGRHALSLVAGGSGEIAYILAISVERIGPPGGVVVCVGGPPTAHRPRCARQGARAASESLHAVRAP